MSNERMSLPPLKPCPFCGGEAILWTSRDEKRRTNPSFIRCEKCGAQSDVYERVKETAKAWDRRAGESNERNNEYKEKTSLFVG